MPKISKKIRRYAADLLAACASEMASIDQDPKAGRVVWIAEIAEKFLANEPLDLYETDQVMLVAAVTFRGCSSIEPFPQSWIENYLEASERLREGFIPNLAE